MAASNYHFDDETPLAFQDSMSRFGADETAGRTTLTAYYFDCLHADGVDLIDRPLRERRATLDRVVGTDAIPGVVTADATVAAAGVTPSASYRSMSNTSGRTAGPPVHGTVVTVVSTGGCN